MRRMIRDTVTVITGASSGIGRATALALAKQGGSVVVAARRKEALEELVLDCEALGGHALAVPVDVTEERAVETLARAAVETFGRLEEVPAKIPPPLARASRGVRHGSGVRTRRDQKAVDLENTLRGILEIRDNEVHVIDADKLREKCIDRLVYNAVFHESEELRYFLHWLIREAAAKLVIDPTSIQGLYEAAVRGAAPAFTTPTLSLHALSYEVARACFRAARETAAGAFSFEFTEEVVSPGFQPPVEYATCVLAAAIRERHKGPVFLQSDHLRVGRASYRVSRDDEIDGLKDRLEEAVTAGFFNIDIRVASGDR